MDLLKFLFSPLPALCFLGGLIFLFICAGIQSKSIIFNTEKVGRITAFFLSVLLIGISLFLYIRYTPIERKTPEEEKQIPANLSPNDIDNDNLIKNGGFEQDLKFWGTGRIETFLYKGSLGIFWANGRIVYIRKQLKDTNLLLLREESRKIANVRGEIDSKIRKSGEKSFKITMSSPMENAMYGSMSQRITGMTKNTEYIARFWVKAERAGKRTFEITTDDQWKDRKQIDEGTYDWHEFKHIFNIGDKTYIDFRIISEEPGTVWVDNISFKKHFPDDKESD